MSIHLTNTLKFPILRNVRASLLINSDIINDRLIYETILIFFDRESRNFERSIVDVSLSRSDRVSNHRRTLEKSNVPPFPCPENVLAPFRLALKA